MANRDAVQIYPAVEKFTTPKTTAHLTFTVIAGHPLAEIMEQSCTNLHRELTRSLEGGSLKSTLIHLPITYEVHFCVLCIVYRDSRGT